MSKLKDDTYYCERCGISFLWTKEEQEYARIHDQAVQVPSHCAGCRHLLPNEARERGLVKWFNRRKRFGFITQTNGEEIFAHGSQIKGGSRRLQPGDLVEYTIGTGDKGPSARKIRLLQSTALAAEAED